MSEKISIDPADGRLLAILNTLVKTPGGRALLQEFIDDAMTTTFTTDPIMNAFIDGKQHYGRRFYNLCKQHHPKILGEVVSGQTD